MKFNDEVQTDDNNVYNEITDASDAFGENNYLAYKFLRIARVSSGIDLNNNTLSQEFEKLNPYACVVFIHRVATEIFYNSQWDKDEVEKYVNGMAFMTKLNPTSRRCIIYKCLFENSSVWRFNNPYK